VVPVAVVQILGTLAASHGTGIGAGAVRGAGDGVGRGAVGPGGGPFAADPLTLTPLAIGLLVAGVVALPFRYRAPVAVLAVTLATTIGYAFVVSPRGPFVAALTMALVNAVFRGRRREALVAAAVAFVVLPWTDLLTGRTSMLPWGAMTLALAWATATIAVAELARVRVERAAEVRRSRAEAEVRQAGEERIRIARELHDSVAHAMSLITLQAGVALHLGADLPEPTRSSLTNIRDASREALVELRTILGVLRSVDADPSVPRAPTPGLDRLPELAERARAAGLDVSLAVDVDGDVDGPGAGLASVVDRNAFRIVQESITNVMKHARGNSAAVVVEVGEDTVDITVTDRPGPGEPDAPGVVGIGATGNGLIGMRERATAVGGSFSAGPLAEGGWQVRARLPRVDAARTGGTTP
jgi:signal transduction histidine kinase